MGKLLLKRNPSFSSSDFWARLSGTIVTSVTVTTTKIWLKKYLSSSYSPQKIRNDTNSRSMFLMNHATYCSGPGL